MSRTTGVFLNIINSHKNVLENLANKQGSKKHVNKVRVKKQAQHVQMNKV